MTTDRIPYRGAKSLSAGWNIVETIPISEIGNNTTFTLDITIQSGNGNNLVECCSFIRCISTYVVSGGVPTNLNKEVLIRRDNNTGGGSSITLVDGVDYQEIINGSNEIEIQIDKGSTANTDVSWSIIIIYSI